MLKNNKENAFLFKVFRSFKHLLSQLHNTNIVALLLLDGILLPFALISSILLRLGGNWDHNIDNSIWIFIALPIFTIPLFISLGLYQAVIKYLDEKVVIIVFIGVSLSVIILIILLHLFHIASFPKSSIIIYWIVALAYIGGTRILLRGVSRKLSPTQKNKINVAIYGAGSAGVALCASLQTNSQYNPIAFFDDDYNIWGNTIKGIQIYRPKDIAKILKQNNIQQILLAIPSASNTRRKQIINLLEPLAIQIKTIPTIAQLISKEFTVTDIKEIEIEDLLGREQIPSNKNLIKKNIFKKNVLITGAGGSIGSEIVRQAANLQPQLLILFDINEFGLYQIHKEIKYILPNIKLIDILGNINDLMLLEHILIEYQVNTIYHAAAYKHVPIVEFNPLIGIYNNTIGTYNVAKIALKCNVDTMVMISTDKAVRPTNIMGASKRLAELTLQALQQTSTHTIFSIVRFGNVLGSSGSVVPLFREQIKNGGPITVTHKDIIRYFMTISEAVQLVIQAGTLAKGGEIFILDMGEPVKITDLAKRMIHLSGFSVKDENNPDGDIEIHFTGLRPGEKMFEELLINSEPKKTLHPRIMEDKTPMPTPEFIDKFIIEIENSLKTYDIKNTLNILQKAIVEYKVSNEIKTAFKI